MNTGSGKTVVGLLILKSCLNEGKSPAVYVCPDSYLVRQVVDAAKELGVEVTEDTNSPRFLSGKAILVINIYKLINGKSVFGIVDEGCKIKISSLLIDDAHACIETIEEQFTIKIPNNNHVYDDIFEILRQQMYEQCESRTLEIEAGNPSVNLLIPYWTWQSNISSIIKILVKNSNEEFLKFIWPLLKDSLKLCNCVISAKEIEISPFSIPIHVIPSIQYAHRKIFMTATLIDDSIISTHFGIDESSLNDPIVPDSAGDVGDRMILLPQAINTEINENDIKSYCKDISKDFNVVVIVPSFFRAKFWHDAADLELNSKNMGTGIEELKARKNGLTILVNRYDGIDLPANSCRMLVLDGLPDVRRKIDKIEQVFLMGTDRSFNKIMQRIEQGMGRGVRSNDDFCVVLLVGSNLTSALYAQGGVNKFSPATKAQFDLSEQIAEQIKVKSLPEMTEILNLCLLRNEEWIAASKGVLASLKYVTKNMIDKINIALRQAFDSAYNNDAAKSVCILNTLLNTISDKNIKGYIKQVMASYMNLYDMAESQKLQLSAIENNGRLLKPIAGIQYHKILGNTFDQAVACSNFLSKYYKDPNNLLIDLNSFIDALQFKENSSNSFEEYFKKLAMYIGLESQRPEQDFKKGPDVLWKLEDNSYLVIECKNEATSTTISKSYCNQLNGSCMWFETKYEISSRYTPILIHPSSTFEYASSPNQNIQIIDNNKLGLLVKAFSEFIRAISKKNELTNSAAIREKLISYRLRGIDIVKFYTKKYSIRNTQ